MNTLKISSWLLPLLISLPSFAVENTGATRDALILLGFDGNAKPNEAKLLAAYNAKMGEAYGREDDKAIDLIIDAYRVASSHYVIQAAEAEQLGANLVEATSESAKLRKAFNQKYYDQLSIQYHAYKLEEYQNPGKAFQHAFRNASHDGLEPDAIQSTVTQFLINEWGSIMGSVHTQEGNAAPVIEALHAAGGSLTEILVNEIPDRYPGTFHFDSVDELADYYRQIIGIESQSILPNANVYHPEFSLSWLVEKNPHLANDTLSFLEKLRRYDQEEFDTFALFFAKRIDFELGQTFAIERAAAKSAARLPNTSGLVGDILAMKKAIPFESEAHQLLDKQIAYRFAQSYGTDIGLMKKGAIPTGGTLARALYQEERLGALGSAIPYFVRFKTMTNRCLKVISAKFGPT